MQPNSIPNVPWGLVQVVVQIPFFGPTIPNQGLVFNGADKSAILGTDLPDYWNKPRKVRSNDTF